MNLVSTSEKQKLDNYFTRKNSSEEFDLIRDELLWSYHSVRHNHSFRSMDCTSNLLKLFCNKKFSCARTKTEALVKNVIGEWCNEHLKKKIRSMYIRRDCVRCIQQESNKTFADLSEIL